MYKILRKLSFIPKFLVNKVFKPILIFSLIFSWVFQIPLGSNTYGWLQFKGFPLSPNQAQAAGNVSFVASSSVSAATTSASFPLSFSGLSLQQGDLVIVANGWSQFGNGNPGVSTAGYTEIADLHVTETNEINFSVNWKIMATTTDTSVTCNANTSVNYANTCAVYVLRGVDQSTPFDVASTTATAADSNVFNSPSITPVTAGALVISLGLSSSDDGVGDTTITAPSGYSNSFTYTGNANSDGVQGGIATKVWSGSGAEDPAAWSNISSSFLSRESWAAVTLAIRPEEVPDVPIFYESDGTNQIAFNNIRQSTTTPLFRASALSSVSFTKFQLELNTLSDFTGTSYTQTFTGTYASGTAYNLYATNTSPSLPTTDGATYYVRARASINGSTYSDWSTATRTFTYKSSGNPDWFQTTNEQFNTGTLNNTAASSGSVFVSPGWYNNNWGYRKKITIDYTKVSSGPHTDFPILISKTDADLLAKAKSNGFDILFTSSNGTTTLSYEREKYSSTTGELLAWVKIPSLSSSTNTEIFMYYGNSSASDQQNATGTWNSNYVIVQHLDETPANGVAGYNDSTVNNNDGTPSGFDGIASSTTNGVGFIDGADVFNGSDTKISIPAASSTDITGSFTLSAWINRGATANYQRIVAKSHTSNGTPWTRYGLIFDASSHIREELSSGGTLRGISGATVLSNGTWYYTVATYDVVNMKVFLNGVSDGTFSATDSITLNTMPVTIGASGYDAEWFNGIIDEVRVSNTARSAGWILTEYNNQSSTSTFYSIAAEQASSTTNSIMSPSIPFSNFYGKTHWDEASWSETETGGTVSIQVYYGSNCSTIIPNGDLPGNSSGFTTGPINLFDLSTSTYSSICLKGTLVYSGSSPSLNDWTVGAATTKSVTQLNYRFRNDNGTEISATYAAATNTAITSGVSVGDRIRLRIQLSNTGDSNISSKQYRLEYGSASDSCTTWTAVPSGTTAGPWTMDTSPYVSDMAVTTDSSGIANPAGKTFTSGFIGTNTNQTSSISLSPSQFTEIEYSIRSTSNITLGLAYCFRVTHAGVATYFVYSVQPQITVSAVSNTTRTGGSNTESGATPNAPVGGGGGSGGTGTEQSPNTTPTSTPTPPASGGGGDVG